MLRGSISKVGTLSASITGAGTLSATLAATQPPLPDTYPGPYEVTPGEAAQVLGTAGLLMDGDVTVGPIPSNYGRIAWNGSTLTVY